MERPASTEGYVKDQPFGAPVGKLDQPLAIELKNELSNIPSQSVEDMLRSERIQPRQMGTGVMRGTQRIVNPDGSYITIGAIPDTSPEEFGIAFFDSEDTRIFKITGESMIFYDKNNDNNSVVQVGKLPDDTYGLAAANEGFSVEDGF